MKIVNIAIALLVTGTQLGWGSLQMQFASINQAHFTIPTFAATSGQTKVIEWGCPIDQERRQETSRKMTLNTLVNECTEQVSQMAASKPNVTGVIRTSLISPDITFQELADGSRIVNGTIFLQTVVAMNASGQ
jgi:hypothetical protein